MTNLNLWISGTCNNPGFAPASANTFATHVSIRILCTPTSLEYRQIAKVMELEIPSSTTDSLHLFAPTTRDNPMAGTSSSGHEDIRNSIDLLLCPTRRTHSCKKVPGLEPGRAKCRFHPWSHQCNIFNSLYSIICLKGSQIV
jgi:hypothetical protein